jgi:hypothetical protein
MVVIEVYLLFFFNYIWFGYSIGIFIFALTVTLCFSAS